MKRSHEYEEYMTSEAWAKKRNSAFLAHGQRCKACGVTGYKKLQVHHKTYDRLFKENVAKDLIVLCQRCHSELHRFDRANDLTLAETTAEYITNAKKLKREQKKQREEKNKNKVKGKSGKRKRAKRTRAETKRIEANSMFNKPKKKKQKPRNKRTRKQGKAIMVTDNPFLARITGQHQE